MKNPIPYAGGDSETGTFEHGEKFFKTEEYVFAFHPLEHADFRDWKFVIEAHDYRSVEAIYNRVRPLLPPEWGNEAPEFSTANIGFYNTTITWSMLTFGWKMFLSTCLDDEFEPIMEEFAEINRRVFRAYSQLPVNFVYSHDEICMTAGPVCSPSWMHKYVYPRYEEYWNMLKEQGIVPLFVTDGNPDAVLDDLVRCGARGLVTEPYFDFKAAAKKYPNMMLAGEGNNRILSYGTKEDIRKMLESMVGTGKECGGYFFCIGNHIAWNGPGESIKYYLDYYEELGWR